MKNINDPIHYREYILNMLVATAGSWEAGGCQDKALEQKFEHLLTTLHPDRKTALDILFKHLSVEVAA